VVYQVNKPFHLSTSSEILVKIGPLLYNIPVLESLPLKIIKKGKNTGKIYSPSGKFAERAKSQYETRTHAVHFTIFFSLFRC